MTPTVESPRDACARLGLPWPLVTSSEAERELSSLCEHVQAGTMLQWVVAKQASGLSVPIDTYLQAVWEGGGVFWTRSLLNIIGVAAWGQIRLCEACAADVFHDAGPDACRCADEIRRVVPRLTIEMLVRGGAR